MATTLLGQITEDLAGKYNATFGFAESVTGPSGAFLAVFDNGYSQSDAGGYVGASSSTPFLRCRDADALAKGNAVTVRTLSYVVVEVLPNSQGETILRLQKA